MTRPRCPNPHGEGYIWQLTLFPQTFDHPDNYDEIKGNLAVSSHSSPISIYPGLSLGYQNYASKSLRY